MTDTPLCQSGPGEPWPSFHSLFDLLVGEFGTLLLCALHPCRQVSPAVVQASFSRHAKREWPAEEVELYFARLAALGLIAPRADAPQRPVWTATPQGVALLRDQAWSVCDLFDDGAAEVRLAFHLHLKGLLAGGTTP